MKKTTLPIGMHDKLFNRAKVMYEAERTISDHLMAKGFNRIETPSLEHFQVFGDEIDSYHYHLFDKKGELLSLRPDMTSQIGRVIASTKIETPIKFSYSGKVFLNNEEMRGLANEHTQAGVEIIGYPVQEALDEAVISAKEALDKVGVHHYKFEFSHARILQMIFETLELSDSEQRRFSQLIQDKNITGLHEFTKAFPSEFDGLIRQLPVLFGETGQVLDQARALTSNEAILTAFDSLEVLTKRLHPILGETTLDLAQISNRPYYTGIMFKVFGDKVPDAFISGGRYDKLFERFGANRLTAVGWAIDIDSIYQAVQDDSDSGGETK